MPLDITDDIEAVIAGRPLPPAGANWAEEWRAATAEAERDTYRFEKGLNVINKFPTSPDIYSPCMQREMVRRFLSQCQLASRSIMVSVTSVFCP